MRFRRATSARRLSMIRLRTVPDLVSAIDTQLRPALSAHRG
jgi:hypothetical protein